MSSSAIEWTESTWNPVTGCTKITSGCANCYAETMARRLSAMNVAGYENGFQVTIHSHRLQEPVKRRKPTVYFVNSMSDLFHPKVTFEFIDQVFEVITQTPRHIYQILTKRTKTMAKYFTKRSVPENAWLGTTVENKKQGIPRIDVLRQIDCYTRFLSCEPLLEDLGELNLQDISWVIVGGESGAKARPMEASWANNIRTQCEEQKVNFFFKQWGTWGADGKRRSKKANGRLLNGKIWEEYPSL